MHLVYKKHGLLFCKYLVFIVFSHFAIKVFFHVPEIVSFGPIYILALLGLLAFWFYKFYGDIQQFKREKI